MTKAIFAKPILIIASIVVVFFVGLFFIFESTPKTQAVGECTKTYSGNVSLPRLDVAANETVCFDPNANTTMELLGNAVVLGTLRMQPANAGISHTLRFTGADENAFQGVVMTPVDSDVGLWVMGAGKLDIVGAQRTGWVRATNSLNTGGTSVTLDPGLALIGWQVNDEILIVPTALGATDGGEIRTITSVSGNAVTFTPALSKAHPTVSLPDGRTLGAEVANLTRNVKIEGMPPACPFPNNDSKSQFLCTQNNSPGRSHIFISNTSPVIHTIKYAAIRYMGPRKFFFKPKSGTLGGEGRGSDYVLGRYALHFHKSGTNNCVGSQCTVVEGVVARDIGSHAFVPHASHGVTFRDTVSYNTAEEAYWWDPRPDELLIFPASRTTPNPNATNDTIYDHALAAYVKPDPAYGAFRLSAFMLDEGHRNTIRNSVAVAVNGGKESSGYHWSEAAAGGDHISGNVWTFENNFVHNNQAQGIFTWQNSNGIHIINGFTAYHNLRAGIRHGAYANRYNYLNVVSFENGEAEVQLLANSLSDPKQKFNNFNVGTLAPAALVINEAQVPPEAFAELKNWNITKLAAGNKAVILDDVIGKLHQMDLVCWTLPGGAELEQSNFTLTTWNPETIIRVQRRNSTAYQLKNGAFTNIASFAACDAAVALVPLSLKLKGDLDGDGKIGPLDISRLLSKWASVLAVDLSDADISAGPGNVSFGKIDLYDVNVIMRNWAP